MVAGEKFTDDFDKTVMARNSDAALTGSSLVVQS
jgi:hypothetical protein